MFSEPSSQNPHPIIKGDTYNVPFSNQIKPRTSKLAVAGDPSVCLSCTHHLCIYVSLSIIYLSAFCSPSLYHLFSYRLSIHRSLAHFPIAYPYIDRSCISAWLHISLSCYLCVCLIITPLHLSAPFWLRCFYLLRLCVSVSLAGLSCSLSAPGSSPQTLRLLKGSRDDCSWPGVHEDLPLHPPHGWRLGLAGGVRVVPASPHSGQEPGLWGRWVPLPSGASGCHRGDPWRADSGVESGERDVYSGMSLGSRLRRGGQ